LSFVICHFSPDVVSIGFEQLDADFLRKLPIIMVSVELAAFPDSDPQWYWAGAEFGVLMEFMGLMGVEMFKRINSKV